MLSQLLVMGLSKTSILAFSVSLVLDFCPCPRTWSSAMAAMSKEEILPFSFFPPCTAFTTNETLVESVLERESNPRQIDYESIALPE